MPSNLQHPRGTCSFVAFDGELGLVQSGVSFGALSGRCARVVVPRPERSCLIFYRWYAVRVSTEPCAMSTSLSITAQECGKSLFQKVQFE